MRRALVLLGSVIALGAASPAYAANGPVASWPFDEGSGTVGPRHVRAREQRRDLR